jgi:hypothetical protein
MVGTNLESGVVGELDRRYLSVPVRTIVINQFLEELDNHFVGGFGLAISLRVVYGRCGVA